MPITNILNSLKARLISSMLMFTIIALPILAFALSQAFEKHIKAAIKNELIAYSYSILGVAEAVDGSLYLPETLLENQFNVIDSGLYAAIYHRESTRKVTTGVPTSLWQSSSALALNFSPLTPSPEIGQNGYTEQTVNGQEHIVFSYAVSFSEEDFELPVVLYLLKDKKEFNETVSAFNDQIVIWLMVIFFLLIGVQLVWLSWTLKPLARFRHELSSIKQGHSAQIKGDYPTELKQVTEQLNLLLQTEQNQRVRYRNSLSDLAHSLKTPLAVMQTKTGQEGGVQAEINQINHMIEHQLKRAQSAGESSWRLGCDVSKSLAELLQALKKIYQDKQLAFICTVEPNTVFKGDKADLTEMLGNLLDNACKAASRNVAVSVKKLDNELCIVVEDDGVGMSESQAKDIMKRGTRADTYDQGHGIGLAIVKDLVESYQGRIIISRSVTYQGAKFELFFPAL